MSSGFVRRFIAVCAFACVLPGCGGGKRVLPLGTSNMIPVVRFTDAPVSAADRVSWSVNLRWSGYDPDGRVVAYRYATDAANPQVPDHTWLTTEQSEARLLLSASISDSTLWSGTGGQEFHTVSLVAIDDRGANSPAISRSFFATTIAPTVQITFPSLTDPISTIPHYLPPRSEIVFVGDDPDGADSREPASYRWILLSDTTEVSILTALATPDSVRRYYAPRHWAGWDSLPGSARRLRLPELPEFSGRLLVLVAIDAAGAYSPTMSRATNMLMIRISSLGAYAPRFTVFTDGFYFEYASGYYRPDEPADVIHCDAPIGAIKINWFATPIAGARIQSYMVHFDQLNAPGWVLPADSLSGPEPGRAPSTGPVASIFVPIQFVDVPRKLYIEALDSYGARSLAMVEVRPIQATLHKPLLVVKDTRLPVDQMTPNGALVPPSGTWPTQAELDTFLFARGDAPWRYYPAGTRSRPGLFSGYDFDTIGTRLGVRDMTIPLATLLTYRRVIWICDRNGASFFRPGDDPSAPMSALRYMSGRNQVNTLTQYVRAGGSVWLVGGGAAAATNIEYDQTSNNGRYGLTFSNTNNELIPGRFMFDQARWQSELRSVAGVVQIRKRTGRLATDHAVYSDPRLPAVLLPHSLAAGDSFPPNRVQINGDFYTSNFNLEYLSFANDYQEDVDGGPGQDYRAALDTVYAAVGSTLPPANENLVNACMTVYPALDLRADPQVIVSGFDLWSFQRVQCQGMVDFVLQRLWNIAPGPRATGAHPVSGVAAGGRNGPVPNRSNVGVPARRPVRAGRP